MVPETGGNLPQNLHDYRRLPDAFRGFLARRGDMGA
jgi:hypothetical protein